MKIVFLLATTFICNQALFSQWANNEDPLTIKELKLTHQQQKQIRQLNKDAAAKISVLSKNYDSSNPNIGRIEQINGARIKKIRKILTPEQLITWREKLMENRPHRGVTGLPNERTIE